MVGREGNPDGRASDYCHNDSVKILRKFLLVLYGLRKVKHKPCGGSLMTDRTGLKAWQDGPPITMVTQLVKHAPKRVSPLRF